MKGSLRVMVLLFSAMRVQQWLLWVGGVLAVIGCIVPPPGGLLSLAAGLILILVPLLFAGGLLLRFFITPKVMQLIPRAREQMLGGMMLTVAAIATAVMLVSWRAGVPLETLWVVWLRASAAASVLLLSQFVLVTSIPGMILWFMSIAVIASSFRITGLREIIATVAQSEGLLALTIVGSWSTFAFWFLRARSLKSPSDVRVYGKRAATIQASHATALRTFLLGHTSVLQLFAGGFVGVVIIGGFWTLLAMTTGPTRSAAEALVKIAGPSLALVTYAGIGGFMASRRAKYLWLRGDADRLGIFHICEKQAWRLFGATVASVLVLLTIACVAKPEITASYLAILPVHLCAGACLLYLGLMHVRGWPLLDVICSIALTIGWLMAFATTPLLVQKDWVLPVLIAAFAAVAITFRFIGMHRWRRIDWLVCKPPRIPPRGAIMQN